MAAAHDSEKLDPVHQVSSPSNDSNVLKVGSLAFVGEQGGNGSLPTFQEASGAPVEQESPLGYKVQWITIIFLNIGQMIGTGVFSTRETSLFPAKQRDQDLTFLFSSSAQRRPFSPTPAPSAWP